MKIYTRTGDEGDTSLFGGGRVAKHHVRVAAYGAVDELNAVLGQAIAQTEDQKVRARLEILQHDLFAIGSELATPTALDGRNRPETPGVPVARVAEMEAWIDEGDEELPALRAFVLPGGSRAAAALHVARTVCRRAEREVVRLSTEEAVDVDILTYLNRLSDLLFLFARLLNHRAGTGDTEWQKEGGA
jgi:cob(I)alamin adenosyltransferase